jgi:DNA-binding MarR family transcriptional regulator
MEKISYQEWLKVAKTQPQNELYYNMAKYSYDLIIDSAFRHQKDIASDLGIHQSALSNILNVLKANTDYIAKEGQHGNDNTSQL